MSFVQDVRSLITKDEGVVAFSNVAKYNLKGRGFSGIFLIFLNSKTSYDKKRRNKSPNQGCKKQIA